MGENELTQSWLTGENIPGYFLHANAGKKSQANSKASNYCCKTILSILGPILFIIYTNDLPHNIEYGKVSLYADDTAIFYESKSIENLHQIIASDAEVIHAWFRANKLTLNVEKSQFVYFRSQRKKNIEFNLSLGSQFLKTTQNAKYLGVFLDCHLKWDCHIMNLRRKVSQLVGGLWRVRKCFPDRILKSLYKTLFEPHFSYAIEVWGNAFDVHLKSLFVVQKKAIRCSMNVGILEHTANLFNSLQVLTIRNLYVYKVSLKVYKDIISSQKRFAFSLVSNYRNLRSNDRILLELPSVSNLNLYSKQNFYFAGPRLFNMLDEEIKTTSSIMVFKSQLSTFLLKNDVNVSGILYQKHI